MKKILICLVLIFSCALFDCYLEKKIPCSPEIIIDSVLDRRICDEIKYQIVIKRNYPVSMWIPGWQNAHLVETDIMKEQI